MQNETAPLSTSTLEASPLATENGESLGEDASPLLLLVLVVILLAVCWQNWVMGRRAEHRSLVPDWLSGRRGGPRAP